MENSIFVGFNKYNMPVFAHGQSLEGTTYFHTLLHPFIFDCGFFLVFADQPHKTR